MINKNTKVLILAGGKGERFKPFSFVIPKPLMPLNEDPIIMHLIKSFKKYNFKNFFISTGYQSELIKTYLGSGKKFDVKIKYFEENKPLGTAGPIYLMKRNIKNEEYFFLINGDVYTELNFKKMLNFAKKGNFDIVIGYVKKNYKNNFGVLNLKNNNVISIIEKPKTKLVAQLGVAYSVNNLIATDSTMATTQPKSNKKHKMIILIASRSENTATAESPCIINPDNDNLESPA